MIILAVIITCVWTIVATILSPYMSYLLSNCPDYKEWALTMILTVVAPLVFIIPPAMAFDQLTLYGMAL